MECPADVSSEQAHLIFSKKWNTHARKNNVPARAGLGAMGNGWRG
jgi:hypothetical protein